MPFFTSSPPRNLIRERCADDNPTRLRLRYAPWYHVLEAQRGTTVTLDGRELIMLSSNDYLGLTHHPRVIEAAARALETWGTSTTGARLANGSRRFHRELEESLAAFLGTEDCHVHSAGYLSCLAPLSTYPQRGDIIFADRNLHACMWDGIRLSGATVERFSHNSPENLRELLAGSDRAAGKVLAIEGVYSMEGHLARLPEFAALAHEHGLFTVLDDAHGFGVLGPRGTGTVAHFGPGVQVDILCGSLSKSLASTGGFVAGSRALLDYLRTHSKQTIFSAAISPAAAAAALAALRVLQEEPEHLQRLWANTRRYRQMLLGLGLDLWGSETPAIPVVLGTRELAYQFWRLLLERGVFTVMSIAPAVPPGKDLIRTAMSARHTDEQLERVAEAFAFAKRKLL